ncbi:MAG TPA: dihydroxyacetone kinase subunit DhaL [Candidatus Udaeobacter sp.]|nr:dihydroxyacetone kinase subunit DhaL [Candidatus Udaeobacter sp.]
MTFDSELKKRLIVAAAQVVIENAEELTALDRAIGDGDHGLNMKRGFEAVLADVDVLAGKPLPDMCTSIGTHLVMTIGGASGPLYGTLFLALGKHLPPAPDLSGAARAFSAAVTAVKTRGRSDVGEKTMIDVLHPVAGILEAAAVGGAGEDLTARLRKAADGGLEATRPLRATKGRASFLGERSVGHLDPGARSSQLLVHAACGVLSGLMAEAGGQGA